MATDLNGWVEAAEFIGTAEKNEDIGRSGADTVKEPDTLSNRKSCPDCIAAGVAPITDAEPRPCPCEFDFPGGRDMTRHIARFGRSSACLALGFMVAMAFAAPGRAATPSVPMVAQADESAAPSADSALPTTEQPSAAEEANRSAEDLPPGSPAPSRRTAQAAPSNSAASQEQTGAPQSQESLECEPSQGENFTLNLNWHPFATWRANVAAAHCAPLLFPHYDGEPRAPWVPGAQLAAYVQSSDGSEVVEQDGQVVGGQPAGECAAIGAPAEGSCQPELPMDGCCNCRAGTWFGGSDYYLIRPHQTYDTAFQLIPNGASGVDVSNVNFNPTFASEMRVFAGYQTSCDESFRFSYTYMFNDTDHYGPVPNGASILTPLGAELFPGDSVIADQHILLNAWDFEDVRKLNLPWCACRNCCPMWDVSWSWGARILQIDESVVDAVSGPDAGPFNQKSSFIGAGPRLGLDVHRHLGQSRFSAYFATDAALLVGEQRTYGPTTPSGSKGIQAVPNFDLQIGLAWDPNCHLSFTGGYLFEFFGDATAMSDSPGLALLAPPTASNLSYDGLFVRGEFKF